ncbi:uncharacterized protein LOC127377614 [Dicentrarchus labrax]|uniref:uncharacterized protein LOC127377614 n=1 Tax=Dicentrarchus labrax TaxID=13489 RepID=UPI001637CEFB|nr:uncharacterized protein LOC127377614 [Dicentrarchus labrax]
MLQKVLFIKLLLVHYATQTPSEITAACDEDVQLKCSSLESGRTDFLSVTWYKLDPSKRGIIRRGKNDEALQSYNFTRPARFGEKYSLLLPRVTPEDSGTYECSINANVGRQNQYDKVILIVNVCASQADLTTVTNVLNTTHHVSLCHNEAEDLPVMWSITGYVAVGLAKILLSLISILVIRAFRIRSSRQRQRKW